MGNQRFSITPSRAVEDQDMPDTIFRTLATLGLYGDKNGWCFPSLSTLADIRGKSKAAMSQHIKWLKENGYLNVQERYDQKSGGQRSNLYQIKFDYKDPPLSPELNTPLSPELNPPLNPELNHNAPINTPIEPLRATAPTGFISEHKDTKLHKLYYGFLRFRREGDPDFKDPRLYHPALRLWRGVFELDLTPKGNWRDKIIREVGEDKGSLKVWRKSMEVWAGVSGNPNAPLRVLSIYQNGGVLNDIDDFKRQQEKEQGGDRPIESPLSVKNITKKVQEWEGLSKSGLLDKPLRQMKGANK
jgi:hypothetical protein